LRIFSNAPRGDGFALMGSDRIVLWGVSHQALRE